MWYVINIYNIYFIYLFFFINMKIHKNINLEIMGIIKEKGYALQDILSEVSKLSFQLDLPPEARVYLTEMLAEIE